MKFATFVIMAGGFAMARDEGYTKTMTFESPKANVTTTTMKEGDTKIKEMRRQYRNYFVYSLDAKGVESGLADTFATDCDTNTDCGNSGNEAQCCVHTELFHSASNTKDVHYKCMTKKVAHANMDIQLGDMQVKMRCLGSGATVLALSAVTTAAAMSALF